MKSMTDREQRKVQPSKAHRTETRSLALAVALIAVMVAVMDFSLAIYALPVVVLVSAFWAFWAFWLFDGK